MRTPRPYTSADLAGFLGITPGRFLRNYARYVAAGMPASLTPFGPKKFERAQVDRWRMGQRAAANDAAPVEATLAQWREAAAAEYGARS